MLLVASASMEALRFYSLKATLPLAPGGMLGVGLSGMLSTVMGFTGATLVLLATIAIGLSLFTGISWVAFLEELGGWLEAGCQYREAALGELAGSPRRRRCRDRAR